MDRQEMRAEVAGLWNHAKALPLAAKIGIGAGLLLALLLLSSGIGGALSHFKDARADKELTKEKAEREKIAEENARLKEERDKLIGRAEASEKREADLSVEAARHEAVISAGGERLKNIDRRLEDEDTRYKKDMADSGSNAISPCDRWLRNCETAKRLGVKPKNEPCDCSKIQANPGG